MATPLEIRPLSNISNSTAIAINVVAIKSNIFRLLFIFPYEVDTERKANQNSTNTKYLAPRYVHDDDLCLHVILLNNLVFIKNTCTFGMSK